MNSISLKEIEQQARTLAAKGLEVENEVNETIASLKKPGRSLAFVLAGPNATIASSLSPWLREIRQLLSQFFTDGRVNPLMEDALDSDERWLFIENAQKLRQLTGEDKTSLPEIRTRLTAIATIIAISLKRFKITPKKKPPLRKKDLSYIEPEIIELVHQIVSQHDMARVVRYCEEINSCYANGNFMAVILLVRSLLNHIPPVFGYSNFESFVNQSEKSVKQMLAPLEEEARRIADYYTHSMINTRTPLPTKAVLEPYKARIEFLLQRIAVAATKAASAHTDK